MSDSKSQTPIPQDLSLISYRLKETENNLKSSMDKISDKIDSIIEQLNKNVIAQATLEVKVGKLEEELTKLRKEDEKIQKDITGLKISMAEKLSWGAGGGLVSAFIVKLLGGE